MNEYLTEYYNEKAREIRETSWIQAFMLLAVAVMGTIVLYLTVHELATNERAREVGLVFLGIILSYVALRYALVWVQLRKLKLETAKRAMVE